MPNPARQTSGAHRGAYGRATDDQPKPQAVRDIRSGRVRPESHLLRAWHVPIKYDRTGNAIAEACNACDALKQQLLDLALTEGPAEAHPTVYALMRAMRTV